MKFLLVGINSKFIHSNPAIRSLRANADESLRDSIELAEYTINNRTHDILASLYKQKPDFIGFSVYIWNRRVVFDLLPELKKLLPKTAVWLGGPEVSYDASFVLSQHPEVDGIMVGEGEKTFREVTLEYERAEKEGGERHLEKIAGIVTREVQTGVRELLDLDELTFPYENLEELNNRIIYYESSRGCPYRCAYCISSIDKTFRVKSFEKVEKELKVFIDAGVKQVKFVDRTFNCDRDHVEKVWNYIIDHDNGVTNFHFEVAGDMLNEKELALLSKMRKGLVQLEIGVQTTNPATLKAINRTASLEKIKKNVAAIKENGNVHVHLDLIAGLPYENITSFINSFNEVYEMKPDQLQLGFLKVLKGTEMFDKVEEYGITYENNPPYEVLSTKWLSFDDVLSLKRVEEMVEAYYNSGRFKCAIRLAEKYFSMPYDLFERLALYYEKNGLFVNEPARVKRYDVLLGFVSEMFSDSPHVVDAFRDALTFDYYMTENAKSRPAFAKDLKVYKDEMRGFFDSEEKSPRILKGAFYKGRKAPELQKMTHTEVFNYPVWEDNVDPDVMTPFSRMVLFTYDGEPAFYVLNNR